jgi:carboxypeptidase family protein
VDGGFEDLDGGPGGIVQKYAIALCVALAMGAIAAAQLPPFTDDPVVAGVTVVKAEHVTQLRARINALRAAVGLSAFVFADALAPGVTQVTVAQLVELRTALAAVYSQLNATPPVYTDPSPAAGATPIKADHINELRAAVVTAESQVSGDSVDSENLSPAMITVANLSSSAFNDLSTEVHFEITGDTYSANPNIVYVMRNGTRVPPAGIQITSTTINAGAILEEGPNEFGLLAVDSHGRQIDFSTTLWAGSETLYGLVSEQNGQPAVGATVTAKLGADGSVGATTTTAGDGTFSFGGLSARTILLEATTPGHGLAATPARGDAGFVNLQALNIAAPSNVANNDFSQGTAGWNIGSAPVTVVPHNESGSSPAAAAGTTIVDNDLALNTSGQGAQTITRTFAIAPGTTNVAVRYRFITSEVPGGFFGSQFDDSFRVSVRSQTAGGTFTDSASMNSLGLEAFDAQGGTAWRQTALPVSVVGDVVQAEVSVANVADGLYDSQVVIDVVSEKKIAITNLTFTDQPGDDPVGRLKYLSADAHSYFNGNTQIFGSMTVKGPSNDSLQSLLLEVWQGSHKAVADLAPSTLSLPASFGPGGQVQLSNRLLFELSSLEALNINPSADSTLVLKVRARSTNGEEVTREWPDPSLPPVQLLIKFAAADANRYGPRDTLSGGDDWAKPTWIQVVNHYTQGAYAQNQFGDFSNMNAGQFGQVGTINAHAEHKTGEDVDGKFPNYNPHSAITAAKIIQQLNEPGYGSKIGRVLVAYDIQGDNFAQAISGVLLNDGRFASDVIQPHSAHTTHFHWDLRHSDDGSARPTCFETSRVKQCPSR